MKTFVVVYLVVGFAIAIALLSWAFVASARRHGFRNTIRHSVRGYVEYLPLHPRTRISAWMFVIALPVIAAWEIVDGEWDPIGAVFVAVLWLAYFALLRWCSRARAPRG